MPGNVRELKQKIQIAVLHDGHDMITEADLEWDSKESPVSFSFALKDTELEKERILRALQQARGNKKLATKMLGIGRTTLYNKINEYGLDNFQPL